MDTRTGNKSLPVARFISSLYETKVLRRDEWPASRILEVMNHRGYGNDLFSKLSYGAPSPSNLSLDECLKWVAYFRLVALNTSK